MQHTIKHNRNWQFAIVGSLVLIGGACAVTLSRGSRKEDPISGARLFLDKVGYSHQGLELNLLPSHNSDSLLHVSDGVVMVSLSRATLRPRSMTALSPNITSRFASNPLNSASAALNKGTSIQSALGIGAYKPEPVKEATFFSKSDCFVTTFNEWREGRNTGYYGNHLTIYHHKLTGAILDMTIVSDVTYAPVIVSITHAQAKAKSVALLEQYRPRHSSEIFLTRELFISGRNNMGNQKYAGDAAANRSRYAIEVVFEKGSVYIDASDGSSLGGDFRK